MDIKKYKWLYLWIAAAGLIVFGTLTLILKEFGQSVVIYISSVLLIAFVIIRFVPLIKTTRDRWAICANAIEMFVDLVVGIMLIVSEAKNSSFLKGIYPFLLGGVLYARGFVYLLEISFFKTKPEVSKFFVHLLILSAGVVIMARYDSFTVEAFRWLFGLAFCISGVIAVVDGGNNYNEYRKTYQKKRTSKAKKQETILDKESEVKEDDVPEVPVNQEDNRDTTYIA